MAVAARIMANLLPVSKLDALTNAAVSKGNETPQIAFAP